MDNVFLNIKLVIFTVAANRLRVFLPDNKLPVGRLNEDKSLDKSAELLFRENIDVPLGNIYFEQLYTFSHLEPPEITVVYYFLMPAHKVYPNNKKWYEIYSIRTNKYDKNIINYAVQRLRWKIEYTNAVYSFLPDEFTFSQLQSTYEAILGKPLDKRNFRKKITALNLLKSTGHKKREGRARPAKMFAFKKKELTFVKILQPKS